MNELKQIMRVALRHRWKIFGALAVVAVIVFIIVVIPSEANSDSGELITIITYGHGEQIRVAKGLLYFLGVVIFMIVMAIG